MSYILDALKKSERARLDAAAPAPHLLLRDDEAVRERRVWPYWVAAFLVINLVALWLVSRGPSDGAPGAMPDSTARSGVRVSPPSAARASAASKADDIPVPLAPAVPAESPPPVVGTDVAPSKPVAAVAAPTAAKRDTATPAPRVAAVTPPAVSEVAKEPSPPPPAGDMPEALRRELPPLAIAGVMREQGAAAWVVVNERPLREGDEVAPGLRVEKILEQGVQFSYKGYRFQR